MPLPSTGDVISDVTAEVIVKLGSVGATGLWQMLRSHFAADSAASSRLQRYEQSLQTGQSDAALARELQQQIDQYLRTSAPFLTNLSAVLSQLDPDHEVVISLRKKLQAAIPHDPLPLPVPLFGRDELKQTLRDLLRPGHPPVLQLIGKSGVGKTALVAVVVAELNLDYVRLELRDVTSLADVTRLYEIFHGQAAPGRPAAELIAAIIDQWRTRNCLLILDNLHVLLKQPPETDPIDDTAALLLERLGQAGGRLLTLGWPGTNALGMSEAVVRRIELEGLEPPPGVAKLRAEGVQGDPATLTLEQVVTKLDGNPKMLEAVAMLIKKNDKEHHHARVLDQRPDWISDSFRRAGLRSSATRPESASRSQFQSTQDFPRPPSRVKVFRNPAGIRLSLPISICSSVCAICRFVFDFLSKNSYMISVIGG